jgi:hypothetical protein
MSRAPVTFRGTDLRRAVKSVKEAGLEIARVEIAPTGSIIIHAGKPEEEDSGNPWDKVLGNEDQDR